MAEKLYMTALSPTMEDGIILEWKKKEGEHIASGDVICEVETDKASMEYESSQTGVLLKILLPQGDSAKVGDVIGILGNKGEDISAVLAESTENATPSVDQSPAQAVAKPEATSPAHVADTISDTASARTIKVSPLARKIAAEKHINLQGISGSGPGGRIVKKDVESAKITGRQPHAAQDQNIPVSNIRAIIARRLSESKFSSPHYYVKVSVDMSALLAARKRVNEKTKVGVNAFLMKFVAETLKRHPEINASWQEDHIRIFGGIDIGVAVDRGRGLITPIVRDCGSKGVITIDEELKELVQKAENNKLQPQEYSGASFTISNLGSFGVEEFTAIINPPGAAILAVGQTIRKPVVMPDDSIAIRPIMKLSLSCDHRVIDGAAAGRFIADLKSYMEDPVRMLF